MNRDETRVSSHDSPTLQICIAIDAKVALRVYVSIINFIRARVYIVNRWIPARDFFTDLTNNFDNK